METGLPVVGLRRAFALVRQYPKCFPRGEAVMEIAKSDFP